MNIKLNYKDQFRISTNQEQNFLDIRGLDHEAGIAVDSYPRFHYIEIREKLSGIRTFYFQTKRHKREYNFGWWEDAEVVFSRNNVVHI